MPPIKRTQTHPTHLLSAILAGLPANQAVRHRGNIPRSPLSTPCPRVKHADACLVPSILHIVKAGLCCRSGTRMLVPVEGRAVGSPTWVRFESQSAAAQRWQLDCGAVSKCLSLNSSRVQTKGYEFRWARCLAAAIPMENTYCSCKL